MPWLVSIFVALASSCYNRSFAGAADPTLGFAAVELTEDRFKPYDLPPEQRYEFRDGVRRKWVSCTDKPFSPGSPTKPRSEILLNVTCTTGVWQFEAYGFVPTGTSGVSVMQVFGAEHDADAPRLRRPAHVLRRRDAGRRRRHLRLVVPAERRPRRRRGGARGVRRR
ncbi:hypothetical protein HU200_013889 [Digitaria exilis]|uniref:Uncharacterized protein n=1 Tax=Digitaria exilis TaxID=1010633 RepID=A0A835FCB8_9POAL|nr:hypothetical protein HU200_013889 [Digitaria exilis]